jgi:putative N6-adenine-specific DNA methylase
MKKYRFEYFASCPMGLEELLSQEILSLGAKTTNPVRGGVQFEAFHEVALKVILHTRLASRVFKYLYTLDVLNEKDYYLEATEIKWKSLMSPSQTFRLTTIFADLPGEREEFRNSQFANLKLKDAIVDYFRHFDGTRPSVEKEFPDITFLARVERGVEKPYAVTLMYDLCGDPLNQRGYRIAKTEAPVKENVAAGLLKLINWNPETEGLLDAMCGSGTIVIEAALMAGNIPPSYLKVERHLAGRGMKMWTFLNYPWFTEDKFLQENFQKLMEEVKAQTDVGMKKLQEMKGRICGSDIDGYSVGVSQDNVQKARLFSVIPIERKDALESVPPSEKSLFICNPPYGERLEHDQEEKLKALYKGLGDHWKHQWKGHRAALFTGNLPMLKMVGLRTSKKTILWNGDIECRLAEYNLY